jgi:hypothetical protein
MVSVYVCSYVNSLIIPLPHFEHISIGLLLILAAKDLDGVWKSENTMSLGELWLELFRFYALDFDILGRVVCIEQSSPLLRSSNLKRWTGRKIAVRGVCVACLSVCKTFSSLLSSRRSWSHPLSSSVDLLPPVYAWCIRPCLITTYLKT